MDEMCSRPVAFTELYIRREEKWAKAAKKVGVESMALQSLDGKIKKLFEAYEPEGGRRSPTPQEQLETMEDLECVTGSPLPWMDGIDPNPDHIKPVWQRELNLAIRDLEESNGGNREIRLIEASDLLWEITHTAGYAFIVSLREHKILRRAITEGAEDVDAATDTDTLGILLTTNDRMNTAIDLFLRSDLSQKEGALALSRLARTFRRITTDYPPVAMMDKIEKVKSALWSPLAGRVIEVYERDRLLKESQKSIDAFEEANSEKEWGQAEKHGRQVMDCVQSAAPGLKIELLRTASIMKMQDNMKRSFPREDDELRF